MNFYQNIIKRLLDIAFAIIGLFLFSPILTILVILIRIKLGTPIIFKQNRPGLHGKLFTIYKFRTMNDVKNQHNNMLPDSERLTPFGKFLRSTSLDELPELINILKGDMSLVGPRPLLMEYLERYSPEQSRRHEVRPGLTGWAQVQGRNAISWKERFELDVWYVNNLSFWLDIKIILHTIIVVIKRKDINQPGRATIDEFMGNN